MQEFKHILFYENNHRYVNTLTGERYMSVTQALKHIQPEVNWDYWAVYKYLQEFGKVRPDGKCERIEINNQWVHYKDYENACKAKRQEWRKLADIGKAKGTFIHTYLENLFNNKVIKIPKQYQGTTDGAMSFYQDHNHMQPVYSECIVGDDEFKIAGQVDRPFFVEPGVLDVYDYKTDKEIKYDNKYTNLKKPVDELPDTNFSKYTLQLNTYRWIIERNTDWRVRELKIVHIQDDSYEVIPVPFYDVTAMINDIRGTHIQSETRTEGSK